MRLKSHAEQEQLAQQSRDRAQQLEKEAQGNDARLRLELNRVQEEALRPVGHRQQRNSTVDDQRTQEIAAMKKETG